MAKYSDFLIQPKPTYTTLPKKQQQNHDKSARIRVREDFLSGGQDLQKVNLQSDEWLSKQPIGMSSQNNTFKAYF